MNGVLPLSMPSDVPRRLDLQFQDSSPPQSPKGIASLTVATPTSTRFARTDPTRPKARWRTPEFIIYAIAFVIVVPWMAWVPYTLSRPSHPNFIEFAWRISPGWILGRGVDNSDSQYRSFRSNIPALVLFSALHLILSKLYNRILNPANGSNLNRVRFHAGFAILMLFGLHGTSALKVLAIISANYIIAKKIAFAGKSGPLACWVFNVVILFLNEWYEGYKFGSIHSSLDWLDTINGAYPRWHVSFNITMLRLISFDMDHWWSIHSPSHAPPEKLNEKQRMSMHHESSLYSFQCYLAYVLYAPLYIAGPIMTFNDFMWQLRRPIPPSPSTVKSYAIRFVVCLLTMEFVLHFMYVVAIKDTGAWHGDSAFELSMIGFWNLIIVWLKLLIPWRFFRLWALIEGIDPPENMVRCMVNNYSSVGFWRAWHRSYNLWLLRYVYIPCGGSQNMIRATVLVFTFVALWHDLSFKLLAWGWLVSLFILPEVAARHLVPASKFGNKGWYRHVAAIGAVFNMLLMMTANLVGFVLGTKGMKFMVEQLLGTSEGSLRFMGIACVCIFIAVQVMFEYREEEMRQGIYRKC